MHTKLIGLCASLVALAAFAIAPALSSAHVADDTVGGVVTKVAVNSKIVGYSEGTSELTSATGLNVKCNENILTGTITRNEKGKGVQGTIEDAWFQSNLTAENTHCSSNVGPATVTLNTTNGSLEPKTHWCIETISKTDKFKVEPRNCGAAGGSFTFVIHAGGISCGFTRSANIEGTFKTGKDEGALVEPATFTAGAAGEAAIEFTTFSHPGIQHSIFCPASGKLTNLTFNLYTDTGVTSGTYSQAIDTADPIWITTE